MVNKKTILSELVVIIVMFFSTDTDIGSKYTDISVRNTEHNFTRLEALTLYIVVYVLVHILLSFHLPVC